jgi:hypothetical protein
MEQIPPSKKALEEALPLSEEILRNLELNEMSLTNIAMKTGRLARLLNEFKIQKIMEYEVSGYPTTPMGLAPEIYQLAVAAERELQYKDEKTAKLKNYVFIESIEELEYETKIAEKALDAARDRDVSVSSANPYQTVFTPVGNWYERKQIRDTASRSAKRLSSRRVVIYRYVLKKHYELKFSGIAGDIFSRIREKVDLMIGALIPDTVNKLSAVYDNLQSENPEDWSNAVHSCRRILQDLADAVFPPASDRVKEVAGKQRTIKLGKDNYINRIMAFVEDRSNSERFQDIVGSHLSFLGDRLDSVFQAAQKGSHDVIVTRDEADRYVVYTYLVVGDVLSLTTITGNTI